MTPLKRLVVSLTARQTAHIDKVKKLTGASAAEIVRRMLDTAMGGKKVA